MVIMRGAARVRGSRGQARDAGSFGNRVQDRFMAWSLRQLIEDRQADQYRLHERYINTSMARVQGIIGFDKIYTRGEGAYLWDAEGTRYLDLLTGFSVFNFGRAHPGIKQALQELISLDRPNLIKMDCPLLAGLLAEELSKRMPPGLDAVFFANSGADAVDSALKFARAATRRPRVLYLEHAFHGLTLGTLGDQRRRRFSQGVRPAAAGVRRGSHGRRRRAGKAVARGRCGRLYRGADSGQGCVHPRRAVPAGSPAPLPQARQRCSSRMKSRWAWGAPDAFSVANTGGSNRIS